MLPAPLRQPAAPPLSLLLLPTSSPLPRFFPICTVSYCSLSCARFLTQSSHVFSAEDLTKGTMHRTEHGSTASMASTMLCYTLRTAVQVQPDAVMSISDRLVWQSM